MNKTLITTVCLTGLLLCQEKEANANNEVTSVALDYLHTPYKYGGTTPYGFDCSGYVQYVFKQLNIELPRTSREQATVGVKVAFNELQVGDIVYFKAYANGAVTHSGIYIGDNEFISSTTSSGVRIDHLKESKYWSKRYAGARRVLTTAPSTPSAVVAAQTQSSLYADVSFTDPVYKKLETLHEQNILKGNNGYFFPEASVTRAEMATIITNLNSPTSAYTSSLYLNDVPNNHWAHSSIQYAASANLIPAYSDGTFRPDETMTTEQVHLLLFALYKQPLPSFLPSNEPMKRIEVAELIYDLFLTDTKKRAVS